MTLSAKTTVIPEKRNTVITATVGFYKHTATIAEDGALRVELHDGRRLHLTHDSLDALIELLHAVKSERSEVKRLIEHPEPHEEIIAVTEATA